MEAMQHQIPDLSAVHTLSQAKMEGVQQQPHDILTKLRKVELVHKQPSAVTSSTLSTTSSDSSSSIVISDQDIHDLSTQEINGSTDVYFGNEYTQKVNAAAQKENEKLRLNLGLPINPAAIARRQPIKLIIRLVHRLLLLVENPLFSIWSKYIPLKLRQRLTLLAWKVYLPVHKLLIGRRTGLHRDASLEYHALTTVIWWGRLFPVTVQRMRFSLSQLHVCHSPEMYPTWKSLVENSSLSNSSIKSNGYKHGLRGHLVEVYHEMHKKQTPTGNASTTNQDMIVTGKFIQHSSRPSPKVIFWIYGGAYLAGDSDGNLGIAEKMGLLCGQDGGEVRDVFIPNYRLVPENNLDDAVHDVMLAYEWLIHERGIRPENVVLLGISSGGGLAVLLMQALAESKRNNVNSCNLMPAGAVLVGPFVDYTTPKGSFSEYTKHDLIVNESVFEEGIPFLEVVLGSHENRVKASPVYGDFNGLSPLCICVSEHEVVYDQSMLLAVRARNQGVDVTVGAWKYMCHVFPMLCSFIPEGRESLHFMADWIKDH